MPARAPRFLLPPKLDDPLADLEAIIDALGPDAVQVLGEHLPPDELADLERMIATRKAEGWRAHPAAMAEHLNRGVDSTRWAYVDLLSKKFAGAFLGTENPHQIWNIPSQYGKRLDVATPIPTPGGWRRMGDLAVGDEVIGGDGLSCTVVAAPGPEWGDCYRLTFHDGAELVADAEHQWRVWNADTSRWEVITTLALIRGRAGKYRIPGTPSLVLDEHHDLLMDPYALGVWLGDGTSAGPGLTCADDEILEHLAAVGEPCRRAPATADRYRCTWAGSNTHPSTFVARLRAMGVLGNKHVPDAYLWAGDNQRLALLQGLMDTDGHCGYQTTGWTQCEFTSTKRCLADAVAFLARSLGIRAGMAEGRATLDGRDCGPKWRVTFTTDQPVFRLSRKAALIGAVPGPHRGRTGIGLRSWEAVPSRPCRCITVDSPDGTYLAGDHLTVTHNTTALMRGVVWALDFNPRLRLMYVSYDANKAVEEGGNARDWALEHSADLRFELRTDRRARGMWRTQQGGGLYCVGVNGGITGYPADGVLLDDLLKGWEAAQSKAVRDATWNIYAAQIRMRVQGSSCPIIDAGTCWHEDDIHARLRADAAADPAAYQWEHIRLPATAEVCDPKARDPLLRVADPLGRKPGEVLEPERFDEAEVASRRVTLGSQKWAAVEQQRPTPQEGDLIKRALWRRYTSAPPRFDELLSSWDTKLKDAETGDFTVGQVWGRTGASVWGLAQYRGQWSMDIAKGAVALCKLRFPAIGRHVIEAGGYGPELKRELERPQAGYEVPDATAALLGVTDDERVGLDRLLRRGIQGVVMQGVKGSKEARALLQVPKLEAGNVHLPEGAEWADALIDEAAAFPKGAHDDMVDAWSQALSRLDGSAVTTVAAPRRR